MQLVKMVNFRTFMFVDVLNDNFKQAEEEMKRIIESKKKMHGIKCLKCPYYLGTIQCITDPCRECVESARKEHPFAPLHPESTKKE